MSNDFPQIRVLLCDDHHIVREGIRSCLADYDFIKIIGEAADGHETLDQIERHSPDVVLMDLNMPGMNGLEATKRISERFPNTKVVALTVHENREYVTEILRSGACGYMLKNTSPDQLVAAVKAAAAGEAYFSPSVSNILLEEYRNKRPDTGVSLSPRERQVLRLVANGNTNKDIAAALNIGIRTVETHRARLMKKLNARTGAELSRIAAERKLV